MPRLVALIPKEKHLLRFAFRLISQIGIHYRNSSLSQDGSLGSFPRKAPRPGDRLPFATFHESNKLINIQDKRYSIPLLQIVRAEVHLEY
jgi:hypothetical protein